MSVWSFALAQSPIKHDRFTKLTDHDIGRLDVAVDDAPAVGVCHGLAQVHEVGKQGQALAERSGLRQRLLKRAAADQLHRVIQAFVLAASQFVHGNNRRMLELARNPRLAQKPVPSNPRAFVRIPSGRKRRFR